MNTTAFSIGYTDGKNGDSRQGSLYFTVGSKAWREYNTGYDKATKLDFSQSVVGLVKACNAERGWFGVTVQ